MRHSQLCSIRCSCEKTMAGHQSENNLKRGPDDLYEFHPPQLRPAKFSRQTLGDDVGSSADHSVDVDMLGPGGRVSLGKKAKPDASMHDSTDAGLGFNCTALAEVLQSEEFLAAEDMKEAPLADVYMRRGAKYAHISWNCMLTQITKRLKLKMHDYGYLHMEGTGAGVEAWIRVEVPVKSEVPTKKVEKFFGNHSCCRYDALESACKAAVRFLRRECDVIILDANYGEMKAMEKRAKMEEDFSNMYVDMIAARDKHEAVMHAHYASIFSTAKGICKEFRDVFPVMVEDVAVPSTSASEMKIAYAGSRPPITRIDQFAHALVDVLHKGCDLGIACRNVM